MFWILFSVISAFPLWIDSELNLTFIDALFEGVSGITTTGATVIDDVSSLPRAYLYYRSQLNFIGGLGVIVLAVAVLPLLGIGGAKLYQSEMPGPFKDDKLTPRLADTSRTLWITYSLLGIACIVCYRLAGMPLFDAICLGFPQFRLVVSQLIARVSDILITIWLSWWLVLFPCYRLSTSLFGILLLAGKR